MLDSHKIAFDNLQQVSRYLIIHISFKHMFSVQMYEFGSKNDRRSKLPKVMPTLNVKPSDLMPTPISNLDGNCDWHFRSQVVDSFIRRDNTYRCIDPHMQSRILCEIPQIRALKFIPTISLLQASRVISLYIDWLCSHRNFVISNRDDLKIETDLSVDRSNSKY